MAKFLHSGRTTSDILESSYQEQSHVLLSIAVLDQAVEVFGLLFVAPVSASVEMAPLSEQYDTWMP